MVDSRQYWMDQVLRRVAEENLNPEVLSQDYGDPRFGKRPWNLEPESKPFMGDWIPALADKIGSGISGAARWVDENVPSMDSPIDAELLASFIEPLRGSDLGFTGEHAGDVYPGAPKAAGMVIGPAAAFVPKGYKAIKRLLGGADEVVFQPKLPGTAQKKKKKSEPKKEQKIDKLSKKERQKEALENQGEFPQSPNQDRKSIGMSQKQYDDLIEGGWDHQKIMDEHEIVPRAKRREGAGPVRKLPKKPKQLTDEEYDLMFGLEESLRKLDEMRKLQKFEYGKPYLYPEVFNYKGVFNYLEVEEIKKIAKKAGWRGPVDLSKKSFIKTSKAILELASEKLDGLRKRSDFWNVDTHIKRNAKDQIEVGPSDKWGPQDEDIFRSPVRKVPKNPKPLTDEEYDLALGLEKDINKLLEVNELISQADETIDPKALAFYGIQPIKKMAKKIGWRGPVNEETKDAIFDLAIEKYNKLYDRAEVWNVDTHIWLENYITGTN